MGISRGLSAAVVVSLFVTQVAYAEPAEAPASPPFEAAAAPAPVPASAPASAPLAPLTVAPPSDAVAIEIHGAVPGLRLEVQDPKTRRPLAFCTGACQATIMPGRYRFFVNATRETRSGGRDAQIVDASKVLVTPRSEAQHTTGLVLGIAGPALMVLGAVVFFSSLSQTYDSESSSSGSSNQAEGALTGLGMMLGGTVLTPIGWVMFGTSFRPRVTVTPLPR